MHARVGRVVCRHFACARSAQLLKDPSSKDTPTSLASLRLRVAPERLDYSAFGQFTGGGSASGSYYHDYDGDNDVDMVDFINFQTCFGSATQACKDVHDSDGDDDIDLDDFEDLLFCFGGPFVIPDPNCGSVDPNSTGAATGTFALHGRPIEAPANGPVLYYGRARHLDPFTAVKS